MALSKEDIQELVTATVAVLQTQATQPVEKTETVSFFPERARYATDLDKQVLCRDALAGRGCMTNYSQEEIDSWQRGEPLSRHQLSNRARIIHYDAVKARELVKSGHNKQCISCGNPRS